MNKIEHSLKKIFENQRIVLWYAGEEEAEMQGYYEEMDLEGVSMVKVENDEFAVKYRVLKEEPQEKFLLFIPSSQPPERENWLLDLCLANHVFSTDESAIYLQELGLDIEFKPLISEHLGFFKNKDRLAALKRLLKPDEDFAREIRYKMLAAVGKTEPTVEAITMSFIAEAATGENNRIEQAEKYNLLDFFWKELERQYGYLSDSPTIEDFVKALFQTQSSTFLPREKPRLNREAIVFVKRWKDSARNQNLFEFFSRQLASEWQVEKWLETLPVNALADADLFELIDQKILSELKQGVLSETSSLQEAQMLIEQRKQKYWYPKYRFHYSAIEEALSFFEHMRTVDFRFSSGAEAIRNYINHYHKIDTAYRRYFQAIWMDGNPPLLAPFTERIEREYGNNFLLKLNDRWQEQLDALGKNAMPNQFGVTRQRQFWKLFIEPYLEKGNRIFVIISDALRYESGADLCERLLKEARFDANIEAMVAAAPTYTQLGMAALLPHEKLAITDNTSVLADGNSTQGTANRDKILKAATRGKAVAIRAEDFHKEVSPLHKGRQWVAPYQVVYIYSNTIDKAGEGEEEKVFQRTEEEFEHIIQLLRKIAGINGNNVIITSDHGYLYQFDPVAESDFANFKVTGDILKQSRRCVFGRNLKFAKGAMHFQSEGLGLEGDMEVVIPKSVNRFRQSGTGSRYVHYGMSLQELVIPLIQFTKKRTSEDDISLVDVELIRTASRITSNQIVLSFYQKQPVQEKWHPRELRLGFYDYQGNLISDVAAVRFDSSEASERKREKKVTFHFSKLAEERHNQEVYLRMEDESGGKYDEAPFTMMISFTSDFDDFDI